MALVNGLGLPSQNKPGAHLDLQRLSPWALAPGVKVSPPVGAGLLGAQGQGCSPIPAPLWPWS